MDTPKNKSSKESQKCLSVKSPLRKESMRMMKCTTESKSKDEEKKKSNKDELSSKMKKAIKNPTLRAIKTKTYGVKSSRNKSQPKNQLLKNPQIQISQHRIKSLKIKVWSEIREIVSTKSHGWRMSTIKMTRRTIRKERNRKKSHSWNLSIQMETDLIQTWSNLWKGKLWISTQTLLLMILQN